MIISIANQKGGTGKTSSVINIGAGLVQLGKSVLLIDLDPQIDLSESLGISEGQSEYTINDVINKKVDISKAIIEFDNGLNVIPGSHKLTETTTKLKVNNRLKEILKDIKDDYDYILIDTAPSLTILTVNSFVTSHEIWISFQPEWLATTGIKNILDTIKLLRDKLNINPTIRVIVNMYDQRKLLHRESVELIKKHFDNVFSNKIRTNVSVAEAPGNHKTIFEYSPNSHGAIDYMALCKEIERKVK